ncbi:hypothetical protein [Halolamina sp. C58]|uniref:hypothetical protein n=1 Tax=Halolamina sp. C58 TaxID=3421640 RepID=UPI003EBE6EA5
MRVSKIAAVTMATMLLLAGTVAVGAATPAEQANDTAPDAPADDGTVGPSDGLPEQAADHVSGIHERIESFLNGSIDDLGGSLSEFLGGGEQAADEQPDEADGESDA